ncbi:MAG: flagellar protein, partial [Lachnospiraceae bacterium]|nr:flagellar protein [Lachnospiraceae bacterium]
GQSFGDILGRMQNAASKELRFSKHATDRLATRDISLDDSQLNRLQDGVARAKMKGIKESLMIMDKLAFIVNIPSGTVVTALDSEQSTEQVFTNIDGAVIV